MSTQKTGITLYVISLIAYNLLSLLLSPIFLGLKAKRFLTRKHHHEFDLARLRCKSSRTFKKDNTKKHIAFIGNGIAEMNIIKQIDSALKHHIDSETSWTSRSRDVRASVLKEYPHQIIAPLPFDTFFSVYSWFEEQKPDVIVIIGRLIRTNILLVAAMRHVKVIAIDTGTFKYDPNSLRNRIWLIHDRIVMGVYSVLFLQREEALTSMRSIVSRTTNTHVTGFLKLQIPGIQNAPLDHVFHSWLEDNQDRTPVFVAGSTHADDEELVVKAFLILKQKYKCQLILAPRRLERVQNLSDKLVEYGLSHTLRSQLKDSFERSGCLILDSMGELMNVYRYARCAYVGGEHNIIEPLAQGVPVAFKNSGKSNVETQIRQICVSNGVAFEVSSFEHLASVWESTLIEEQHHRQLSLSSKAVVEKCSGAMERLVELMLPEI